MKKFLVFLFLFLFVFGCVQTQQQKEDKFPNLINSNNEADNLVINGVDNMVEGKIAEKGDTVKIHYTGKFEDGEVFDSSIPRGEPLEFVVGSPGIIVGFSEGVEGMKEGEKKTVSIPPEKAYGINSGHPLSDKTLIFDLELVSVEKK